LRFNLFYIIGIPHIHPIPHIHHHIGGVAQVLQSSSFLGKSVTTASVVKNIQANEIDSSKATLSTFLGSIIHSSIISTKLSLEASYP
jgi:hypothetical protein